MFEFRKRTDMLKIGHVYKPLPRIAIAEINAEKVI